MKHEHHYQTTITWSAGAEGGTRDYKSYSRSHDAALPGKPGLALSADKAFRGDPARINPEDCLLVALASCHMLSYLALASMKGLEVLDYSDEATGTMVQTGVGGRFSEVWLRPQVTVAAGSDLALAESLHQEAGQLCFIASSVNFPVHHEAEIRTAGA